MSHQSRNSGKYFWCHRPNRGYDTLNLLARRKSDRVSYFSSVTLLPQPSIGTVLISPLTMSQFNSEQGLSQNVIRDSRVIVSHFRILS
jgi:hypothetical protein